jgi:hypothetical protein
MKLKINDKYEVSTYEYGYKVHKLRGRQWKIQGYYNDLRHAINGVFENYILEETNDFIVDFENVSTLDEQKMALIERIKEIRNEILEGLK